MKKIALIFSLVLILFACNNNKKTGNEKTTNEEKKENIIETKTIDEIVDSAQQNVGKTIIVKGLVNHTCSHSGRRCFLVNDDESLSIRVEAGGDIKSFSQELIGAVIKVKGTIEEQKLTSDYINEFEANVKEHEADSNDVEEGGGHCNTQMSNIKKMRKWMEDNKKDYYPTYFIAGESYEVVE